MVLEAVRTMVIYSDTYVFLADFGLDSASIQIDCDNRKSIAKKTNQLLNFS